MAYTEVSSNEIPEGTQYYSGKLPLGDYNFYLKIDATGVSPKIVAQCESPDGEIRTAAAGTLRGDAQIRGWSVEANETEASVYATVHTGKQSLVDGDLNSKTISGTVDLGDGYYVVCATETKITKTSGTDGIFAMAGDQGTYPLHFVYPGGGARPLFSRFTYDEKTVSCCKQSTIWDGTGGSRECMRRLLATTPQSNVTPVNTSYIGWSMIYSTEEKTEERLVARFFINLGDAGGYPGGGGGWISPGDWNPDPTTTLHLTVNGALSGRHNDPLTDPSYSYVPADNTAQAGYGCGGDGGHGGGGGAGASTIIVRQFATNKANSKEILALAKRHGYGSGGSKGAKGGDGCILIYY